MQEFWFCEACKSMNRGDADYCYRCRAPKAGATMATIHERRLGGVLMPDVDQLEQGTARAMLTQHPYNPAWPFGYISVGLMIPPIVFQLGFMLAEIASLIALIAPDRYTLGPGWSIIVDVCLGGYAASLVVLGVVHSVFLGLTDMNVPSLGGGKPRFEPQRAFAWWIESALWFGRAFLTVNVPLYIGIRSMEILGLLFGFAFIIVLTTVSVMLVGNPVTALRKPSRLLEDLTERLALRATPKGMASMWSAAWVTARMIEVVVTVVVVVGTIVIFLAAIIQMMRSATGSAPASELNFITSLNTLAAAVLLMAVARVAADVIALLFLARITLSLSGTQRVRRDWVVEGAGWPAGQFPTAFPAAMVGPEADPVDVVGPAAFPAAGSVAGPPWTPAPPAIPEQPRQPVSAPPAPSIPRPRWIQTQEQMAGEDATTDPPQAEADEAPIEPLAAESEKPVLRPSLGALPHYLVPSLAPRPAHPDLQPESQPAESEPGAPVESQPAESEPGAPVESQPAESEPGAPVESQPAESEPGAPVESQPAPLEPDWPEGI